MAIVNVMPAYHKVASNAFDQALLLELLRTDVEFSNSVAAYVWDSLEAEQDAFREKWLRTHDATEEPPKWRALACGGEVAAFVVDFLFRLVEKLLSSPPQGRLARALLTGDVRDGDTVTVDLGEGGLQLR